MEYFNGKLNSYSTHLKKQVLEVNSVTSHLLLKLISEQLTSGTTEYFDFEAKKNGEAKTEVIERDDDKISPARSSPTCYLKSNKKEKKPSPHWTCWARHIKSVDGFDLFRLSYFDYSDLQLFSIFIFEVDV